MCITVTLTFWALAKSKKNGPKVNSERKAAIDKLGQEATFNEGIDV
jgi:hypothetical protein